MKRIGAVVAVAVGVLGLAGLVAAGPADLMGAVKVVEEGGAKLELKTAKGAKKLTVPESAPVLRHRVIKVGEIPAGANAHLLARFFKESQNPKDNSTIPAEYGQVQAVVVEAEPGLFKPPALTEPQTKRQLEWVSGALTGGPPARLGSTAVQLGMDRPILLVERATRASIAKGEQLVVSYTAVGKELTATGLTVIAPGLPAAEYRLILGQ